jgi:hypothetical protein
MHLAVNLGGIPHLAKNERDMGHPSSAWECRSPVALGRRPCKNLHHSLRKACTGLIEAARCAGITLATKAQNPSATIEPASTSGSQLFTW